MGRNIEPLSPADRERLKRYTWPGNVRELQNVIERAVITATDGRLNLDRALPETAGHKQHDGRPADESRPTGILAVDQFQTLERENLLQAMTATGWRVSGKDGAARLLGIPPLL